MTVANCRTVAIGVTTCNAPIVCTRVRVGVEGATISFSTVRIIRAGFFLRRHWQAIANLSGLAVIIPASITSIVDVGTGGFEDADGPTTTVGIDLTFIDW